MRPGRRRAATLLPAALALVLGATPAARADLTFRTTMGGPAELVEPSAIAVDAAGAVYVADAGADQVVRFAADGTPLGALGAGELTRPAGVAVDRNGDVWVTDASDRLLVFRGGLGPAQVVGSPGSGDGQFRGPAGVAVEPTGSVLVADAGNARVERFTPEGAFDVAFGDATRYVAPAAVAADTSGSIYVADGGAGRVERATPEGAPLASAGAPGGGDGQFSGPSGIAADAAGAVYVADRGNGRVQKLTPALAFVRAYDGGGTPAPLQAPAGVAADGAGGVYVADAAARRVVVLTDADPVEQPAPPPPVVGESADAEPVAGTVLVRLPGGRRFRRLRAAEQIPIGSTVDVRHGTVRLTTARDAAGTTQASRFYGGVFRLEQRRRARHAVVDLVLVAGSFRGCPVPAPRARAARKRRHKPVRELWGAGKGEYRTRGHNASGAVRGTIWLTRDYCDGTLVKVRTGIVAVRDFRLRRTVLVRAGGSYFARARR